MGVRHGLEMLVGVAAASAAATGWITEALCNCSSSTGNATAKASPFALASS